VSTLWLRRCWSNLPQRRWLATLLALALAAAALWLLLRALPGPVDPTWERILETGELRICTDPSWPPFESIDERSGEIEGLDVDLGRELAGRLAPNVRAQFVTVGFDGLYDALQAGRCDLALAALPYEPMRTEDVAYSISYFDAGPVLVGRRGAPGVADLAELGERVVGAEWGFVPEGDSRQRLLLQRLPLRRYDTAEDTLRALHSGEVELALVDRVSALAYLHDCDGLQIQGRPLTDLAYVMPLRLDSFRLLEETDRVLLEMREDGTLQALEERWF